MAEEEQALKINPDLLNKIPVEILTKNLQFLIDTFKNEYKDLFPTAIGDEGALLYLMHLAESLRSLSICNGYSEHISEYKNDVFSTYFVTTVARYLQRKVQTLVLEPTIEGINKKSDISVEYFGNIIYFECKNPRKEVLSELVVEHEQMYSILSDYITKPCDISITYKNSLTVDSLHSIGQIMSERLIHVTGEGTIFNRDDIKIDVTNVRTEFVDIGQMTMSRMWENYHENEINPGTIINRNGKSMFLIKKGVSFSNNIERQFKNSKNKVPKDKPYVLCVLSEYISGSLADNINFVSSLFQPNKYTSFNGVLFVRYSYNFNQLINYDLNFINNPYARNPINGLSNMFINS